MSSLPIAMIAIANAVSDADAVVAGDGTGLEVVAVVIAMFVPVC